MKSYAPVILRLGLCFVFLWFGTSQIIDQTMWTGLIPDYAMNLSGMSAKSLVMVNGIFEVVAAVLLAIGVFVRPVAFLLGLHLIGIIAELGLTPIGVRDIGLMIATFSIALYGPDRLSFSSSSSDALRVE